MTITAKNGQKIKGTSLALKRIIKPEVLESGFPIDEQVKDGMVAFSKEVQYEEMDN